MDLVTSGQINVAPIITSEIKLDDIITDGFDVLATNQSQARILINLTQEK